MLLYSSLHKTLNLDRARQSQIEALRSERGSSSPYGKSDEEDRFGKVVTGQNSKFYAGWSMCAILLLLPLQALNASDLEKKEENYNIALNDYLSQERENSDQNAPLSLSIAETYYQLGAYPWTILYLKRAIKQGMDKTVLEEPLHRLNERLGLPISKPSDISFIDHLHLPFELSKTCTLFFLVKSCCMGIIIGVYMV